MNIEFTSCFSNSFGRQCDRPQTYNLCLFSSPKMKGFILLFFLFQATSAVMHSWMAFYTASSGLKEFPEFVVVDLLDGQMMSSFDSRTNRLDTKQSWITENLGQDYVEQQTKILQGASQSFKGNIPILTERFNQSKGVHILQWMYGCEWDDETDDVNGYDQYGYDGEDFLSFNLKQEDWIAPKREGVVTKHKLDNNKAEIAYIKSYHTQICPDWLKKYVNYGRSSLMRKDLPSVSLLQKTPSSPVSCHATGFYPDRATMFWRKDGEEVYEGVERGEILPNHDGSFQMNVDLDISSVSDWGKYDCVFQLSGVKDIVTKLDKNAIRSNEGSPPIMIMAIVVAAVILVAIAVLGFIVYRKKTEKQAPSPAESGEVQMMMPQT